MSTNLLDYVIGINYVSFLLDTNDIVIKEITESRFPIKRYQ